MQHQIGGLDRLSPLHFIDKGIDGASPEIIGWRSDIDEITGVDDRPV
jgi:hypothetical protein